MLKKKSLLVGGCLALAVTLAACGQKPQTAASPPQAAVPAQAPAATPDYWPTTGWRTSTPEEQGMNSEAIAAAIEAFQGQNLHSVAVVRSGYLVAEAYNSETAADKPQDLRSVTKSVTSALTGIALDEHKLNSLEEKLSDFVPEAAADPVKSEIQVGHLLYMASGLDWNNEGEKATNEMVETPDWVHYIISTPSRSKPGTVFHYSNGDAHLMSAVLQKATGQTLFEYAKPRLFEPLGITGEDWKQDPQGRSIGAWSLMLTVRDMLKFGYLYLHDGKWEGKQVVPAKWVDESLKERVPQKFSDGTQGAYGYFWWIKPLAPESEGTALAKEKVYYAAGSEGQRIFVVPGMQLIVAVTANNAQDENMPLGLLSGIVKAVQSEKALPENPAAEAKLKSAVEGFKAVKDASAK